MIPPQIIWELWSNAFERCPKTTVIVGIIVFFVVIGVLITIAVLI